MALWSAAKRDEQHTLPVFSPCAAEISGNGQPRRAAGG